VISNEKAAEKNEQARGADSDSVHGGISLRILVKIGVTVPHNKCDDPETFQEIQGE
jgi:hypothetical protein